MRRLGKTRDLGAALEAAVRRLDRKGHAAAVSARVLTAWQRIAGGVVAAHTTGAHLRDGGLVVYVDGNSWATHFTAMSEQYRAAVNEALGEDLVRSVRFVVSRKVAEDHKLRRLDAEAEEFYRQDATQPVALTETELAQIEASVAGIPDAELREAVLRATVKDLEWKKGVAGENGLPGRREGV